MCACVCVGGGASGAVFQVSLTGRGGGRGQAQRRPGGILQIMADTDGRLDYSWGRLE